MYGRSENMKKVAVLKETINGENRVILLPKDIEDLARKYEVYVEKGAGEAVSPELSGYSDRAGQPQPVYGAAGGREGERAETGGRHLHGSQRPEALQRLLRPCGGRRPDLPCGRRTERCVPR